MRSVEGHKHRSVQLAQSGALAYLQRQLVDAGEVSAFTLRGSRLARVRARDEV